MLSGNALHLTFLATFLLIVSTLASPIIKRGATPTAASSALLGFATDSQFNPSIYRDGGGGGCVNGLCVIGFSDSTTCGGSGDGLGELINTGDAAVTDFCKQDGIFGMSSFVHNSFSLLGSPERTANTPTDLQDFGNIGNGNSNFSAAVLGPVTPVEEAMGGNFAIWPNSNMVPLPAGIASNQLVGIFEVEQMIAGEPHELYSTMAVVDVVDPSTIPDGQTLKGTRIVPQLFMPTENSYGAFCLMAGIDGYLYMFAKNQDQPALGQSSLKVARVASPDLTDKTKFEYWDGSAWSATQPAVTDTKSNIFTWKSGNMDTGELFWSPHYETYMLVFQKFGGFYVSTTSDFTKPAAWSQPSNFFSAQYPASLQGKDSNGLIYAGHAYPDYDSTGKSLLLSWAIDVNWIQMAKIEWA